MADAGSVARAKPTGRSWIRSWGLWSVPTPALVAIAAIELIAFGTLIYTVSGETPSGAELGHFALIFGLSAIFTEASDRIDRIRQYVGTGGMSAGSMSVWAIAAAVTLPVGWAGLLVMALFVHALARAVRRKSARPHRLILTAASVVAATVAAAAAADSIRSSWTWLPAGPRLLIAVIAALILFQLINYGLVYLVVYLVTRPDNWRSMLVSSEELTFEYVTLILGVFTGGIAVHAPWLTPGVLAVLALLYRGAMVTQLQVESSTDAKTGLLNFGSWNSAARRALVRTERTKQPVAVLIVDLDHFKRINDTYGHMVGDEVLNAVAARIRSELRGYDIVGRFGGEEFVLFLDNADLYAAVAAATRLRESIGRMVIGEHAVQVTASIGVAHSPKSTASMDSLLERADVALYEAKAAGRDTVRALAAFGSPSEAGDAVA